MTDCALKRHGDHWKCIRCGRVLEVKAKVNCRKEAWQLGDDLQRALETLGITEERWKAAKEKLGLPPDCDCAKRKAWLNKAGAELQIKTKELATAIRTYFSVPR